MGRLRTAINAAKKAVGEMKPNTLPWVSINGENPAPADFDGFIINIINTGLDGTETMAEMEAAALEKVVVVEEPKVVTIEMFDQYHRR